MTTTAKSSSLRVGMLLIPPVQLLDAAAIDVFGMLAPDYLNACGLPQPLLDLAIPVTLHYISQSGPDSHVPMTSSATLPVTDSLTSPAVRPGQLDVLIIPGPDPNAIPDQAVVDFLHAHQKADRTDFLIICTGIFPAGYAGLLDGKRVTGPRGLLPRLKEKFPAAEFVQKRWERDDRIWTSGGITNGLDLTAAYLHYKVQKELADLVCAMAEIGDRPQDYDVSKASNTLWWLWLVLRSMVKGKTKHGKDKKAN
ncbi:hypothetical protein LTR47_008535 [Exophiala xenobiotica]|nr:hypothetical protein LTR47_008535 [Exophiala xenobiotica]KAK5280695.1 hypothetical protein LTR40_005971 [Exophiala xenobiotica]KAK5347222.1 hypothetical protein LTR61_009105 [Exophiala xenobiotica]KAK5362172.1 hypothetical protein LTR11_009562 [Exophiala xenobiotica]KAK5363827.1 hypothetical protein LTS03_009556 [Exophiala xenobiotica]